MSTLTIAEAREHLDELCASVAETGEPVVIEHNGKTVQLVPADVKNSDAEIERRRRLLFDSPENARRLRAAIARAREGNGIEMTVEELRRYIGMSEAEV